MLARPRRRAADAPGPLGRQGGTMSHPLVRPRAPHPFRAALVGTTTMALAVVLGPGAASAAAVQLGPLTKVSDGDPFAGCTADNIAAQKRMGAILYPASELEPWVAADPSDPGRLIAGWQQDRWSNGGSRGLVAGVTKNGGGGGGGRRPPAG